MERNEEKKQKPEPELKDYIALVIAVFQTVMVPLLVIIVLLFALVFLFLFFLGHSPV